MKIIASAGGGKKEPQRHLNRPAPPLKLPPHEFTAERPSRPNIGLD
jgi:hypothetical protein